MINEKRVKRFRILIYAAITAFLLVPVVLMILLFSRMISLTNSMIHYFENQPSVSSQIMEESSTAS